jgi:hypothetical protein
MTNILLYEKKFESHKDNKIIHLPMQILRELSPVFRLQGAIEIRAGCAQNGATSGGRKVTRQH